MQWSGVGKRTSQPFQLERGLLAVRMTHQGSADFAPGLLDEKGGLVELLTNAVGPFEGGRVIGVAGGGYVLDVEADGPWTLTLAQPRPRRGATLPQQLSGPADSFRGPLALPAGPMLFEMKHAGKGNFVVKLLDRDGELANLLANEIGTFDGPNSTGESPPGIYWLDITADGPWSIAITK